MKRKTLLTAVAIALLASSSAMAKGLPLASGCDDPNYSWWEYSGIQALTCLFSGQWP